MGNFDLIGSEIREQVSCDRGYFEGQLDFQDLRAGSVIFRDFQGKGEVNFNGAEVRGGLEWLARMKGDEFQPQPYEQLIAVYRRMGHTNWARKVGFELEKQRHRKFKKIKEHKEDKDRDCGWWNFWYGVLRRTIGYGYKPFRSFRLALYGWLVGALLFGGANLHDCGWPVQSPKDLFWILGGENRSECSSCLFVPSEGDVLVSEDWKLRKQIPENYPQFVPAVYALEALFPVFDFGQLDKWHPGKVWLSGARWLLTFFGTVILAILTFFGIGVLGPRWRSDEDNS